MTVAYIGFGANLSNPKQNFLTAVSLLKAEGVDILAYSSLWGSPPWPQGSDQPDYTNAVVKADYSGTAMDLLEILQAIETKLGRIRSVRNAARTLDLDLLIFGGKTHDTQELILPHPRMLDRAFVLLPLCELDESWLPALARLPQSDVFTMYHLGDW